MDGKDFEGSKGEGVTIELGKDLFLKDFDKQLVGVKKNDKKVVEAFLPNNHPKKELANKKTIFECTIKNIKITKENKLDDEFAKKLGATNLADLTQKIKNQISSQYLMALNSITKREILDQLEKIHKIQIPKNLIENEIKAYSATDNSNSEKNNAQAEKE